MSAARRRRPRPLWAVVALAAVAGCGCPGTSPSREVASPKQAAAPRQAASPTSAAPAEEPSTTGAARPHPKGKKMTQTTYPTPLATPGLSGYIAVKSSAVGKVAVRVKTELPENEIPYNLLIWKGKLVIKTPNLALLFAPDGRRLWQRTTCQRCFSVAGEQHLYYQSPGFRLESVDSSNQRVLKNAYFPNASTASFPVTLFHPRQEDYLTVVQYRVARPGVKPYARVYAALYGKRLTRWSHKVPGVQTLAPLYCATQQRLLIHLDQAIVFDAAQGTQIGRFALPLSSPASWSLNEAGELFVLGTDDQGRAVVVLDLEGKRRWRWVAPASVSGWSVRQPPVVGPDGRALLFGQDRVFAVQRGVLAWEHRPTNGAPLYGATLADGTALITAGSVVTRLDSAGKPLFSLDLEAPILTPPVVDAQGRIYLASRKQLFRVD